MVHSSVQRPINNLQPNINLHMSQAVLYFPQSNGEAEQAVGTVKSLLKKEGDPYLALLAYRSTLLAVGFSPAELLMSRKLCSTIPTTRELRKPEVPNVDIVRERDKQLKKQTETKL